MTTHITELREIVKCSSSAEKKLDWTSVESRIKDQVVLRAMTCVQIGSKVTSHYKVHFFFHYSLPLHPLTLPSLTQLRHTQKVEQTDLQI